MRGEAYAFGTDGSETLRIDARGDVVPLDIGTLQEAVRLSSGDFALRTDDELVVLREGAIAARVACPRCVSLAASGDRIATVQQEVGVDEGFDLVLYDGGLRELSRATAAYADGGTSVLDGGDYRTPRLATVTTDGLLVITHIARDGIVRGGPSVVASYSPAGEVRAQAVVDGYVAETLASADALRLAVVGHGSGGACASWDYLSVVDLPDLRAVHRVDILVGDKRAREAAQIESIDDLAWEDAVLAVTVTRAFGSHSECATETLHRRVTFDAATGATLATALGPGDLPHTLGMLGAACDVPVVRNPEPPTYALGSSPLPEEIRIVDAPTLAECRG